MCESYNDQKLKEFLGAVLQAYGIQEATQSSLDLYANAAKDCTHATSLILIITATYFFAKRHQEAGNRG